MKLDEKLHQQMLRKGLNGQKLARQSGVSDSEISRILSGKSQPGLENAFRLARAVGVSLDFLADDSLEVDPAQNVSVVSEPEAALLALARELGMREAAHLLEVAKFIGYGVAMRRLLDAKPTIEAAESPATGRTGAPGASVARATTA
jgi:transcriptional regulator with XRE-family HTH domain